MKKILKRFFAALCRLALVFPILASAGEIEKLDSVLTERGPIDSYTLVRTIPDAALKVDGMNFFGRDLKHVAVRFGPTAAFRLSAVEGAPIGLCYSVDDYVVIFRAGALGAWKAITGITLVEAKLVEFASRCGSSPSVDAWFKTNRRRLLTSSALAETLGLTGLPKNGVLSTKERSIKGESVTDTSIVAYSSAYPNLHWLDISKISER